MIYEYPLKQYELNHFKFICLRRALSAAESEWTVSCTDVACCVSAARLSGGGNLQPRESLKGDFIHLFNCYNISRADILMAIST